MKTYVVIPTLLKSNKLDALLGNLQCDEAVNEILVLDNRPKPKYLGMIRNHAICFQHGTPSIPKDIWIDCEGLTIYEMWNTAWNACAEIAQEDFNIAFLNDDIEIQPNTISEMSTALWVHSTLGIVFPDVDADWNNENWVEGGLKYTTTTAGAGGMTGFCFMVRGNFDIRIDENLKLYWGDDDLVKQVIQKGYHVARIIGMPIKHFTSTTIKQMNPDLRFDIMKKDREYFNQKYGEDRGLVW